MERAEMAGTVKAIILPPAGQTAAIHIAGAHHMATVDVAGAAEAVAVAVINTMPVGNMVKNRIFAG